jgi:hypothetical protein
MPSDLSPDSRVSLTRLARDLGVSTSTVWRWALKGIRGHRLPCIHLGGRRYVTRAAFAAWLDATQAEQSTATHEVCTNRQREAAISRAERELELAGVK